MTLERENDIRARVAERILCVLEEDLEGGDEQILQDVWGDCRNDDEFVIAKNELLAIIDLIKTRRKP